MIVFDDYLPKELMDRAEDYISSNTFEKRGDEHKKFLCLHTPDFLLKELQVPGSRVVFSFIRKATPDFDTDWRIHADNIIQGVRVDRATVLCIQEAGHPTGTAFWSHKEHGEYLTDESDFNRILLEDSEDLSKWELVESVRSKKNRYLEYDAQSFHSKFPNKVESGERIVVTTFYKDV